MGSWMDATGEQRGVANQRFIPRRRGAEWRKAEEKVDADE